jgi:SAM-dependent methyltransferase
MSFPDNSFDLVVSFSALHHVPTVRTHIREISRVLDPDGYALISEPIISTGDWRYPRSGLTKHERGIPVNLFRQMIDEAQLTISREHLTGFEHMLYLARICKQPYNRKWAVKLDSLLCSLPFWSERYHATSLLQKLRASSVFLCSDIRKTCRMRYATVTHSH